MMNISNSLTNKAVIIPYFFSKIIVLKYLFEIQGINICFFIFMTDKNVLIHNSFIKAEWMVS